MLMHLRLVIEGGLSIASARIPNCSPSRMSPTASQKCPSRQTMFIASSGIGMYVGFKRVFRGTRRAAAVRTD